MIASPPSNMLLPNCLSLFTSLTIIGVLLTDSLATPTTAEELKELALKPGLDLSGLLIPALSRRQGQGQACGPVTGANVRGVCLNSSNTCCNGFYSIGFCPQGGNNIRCCTSTQHCSGGNGYCNDRNHVSCSVPYITGLCPGSSNVRCCRGSNGVAFCSPGGPS